MDHAHSRPVNPTVYRAIQYADEVISKVKELLYVGADNQVTQHTDESSKGLYMARNFEQVMRRRVEHKYDVRHIRPIAVSALATHTGNCGEQAAVAYCLALEIPENWVICVVKSLGMDHTFVTIGNPQIDASDKVVVIDPWPTQARAVLMKHHFCGDMGFKVLKRNFANKPQNFTRMKSKYNPALPLFQSVVATGVPADVLTASRNMYRQEYTTRGNAVYDYYSDRHH